MTMLGVTASSSGMDSAIVRSTKWVETHITNDPAGSIQRSVVRETVAGSGSQVLMLSRTPVYKVARMFDSTTTGGTGAGTEYCSTDFRGEDKDAGFVSLTNEAGFAWDAVWSWAIDRYPRPGALARSWLVEYEAGWQYACTSSTSNDWLTTTTGRTLPDDVEQAVLAKAGEFYQGSASGIESLRVGPLGINYSSEALDPIAELLAPYRRL